MPDKLTCVMCMFWLFAFLSAVLAADERRPLIGMGGIVHETNTFNPKKTTLRDFETGLGVTGTLRGQELLTKSANANNTIAGFIDGAKEFGMDLYPTMLA